MKLTYKPEIDGLRTIAVFGVIFYHANFFILEKTLFKGGFIGVDIFFVISGYLISGLIFKEIFATKSFSFINFYERRARRILPALILVIIITSIFSLIILFPKSIIDFSKSILSSIFFGSNIYFNYTGNSYGSEHVLLKPLVHTWSLAVEEQFYILFPIFIFLYFKYFKNYVLEILIVGFLISLVLSIYLSKNHSGTNFYQLPSRIFEIIAGSILAYFDFIKKKRNPIKISYAYNFIFPKLGLILIIYSYFFFDFEKIYHPSLITLLPITGVSLIIWFSNKKEIVTNFLSSKILIFFGLISYSLYLWHYPIFSYLRYLEIFNSSNAVKLIAIILTIFFSYLTFVFIEKPFRNKYLISKKKLLKFIIFSFIFLIIFSLVIIKNDGFPKRFNQIVSDQFESPYDGSTIDTNKEIYIIGDSHVGAIAYHLKKKLNSLNYNLIRLNTEYYLNNFHKKNKKNNKIDKDFSNENKKINDFIKNNKNKIIIIHKRWSFYLTESRYDNKKGFTEFQKEDNRIIENYLEPYDIITKNLKERQIYLKEAISVSLKDIIKNNHKLIIVYPVPEMGFDVPRLMNRKIISNRILNKKQLPSLTTDYDVFLERNKFVYEILDNLENKNIYKVYPEKVFCNTKIKNKCVANDEKNLFYYDDDHLSLYGSEILVKEIMIKIKKIINN
mgnify:CR=1 FL=1